MSLKSKFKSVTLLISLLLVLLFSVGFVSATLTVKNTVGSSGINYRAVNDTVGVNVTSSSNVSINGVPCIKQGTTTYICTANDVANVAKAFYQLTNTNGESASASINVDNNIGSIIYTINTQNGTSLDYTIQDLGFNSNTVCSGIASLSVYDGSTLLNTVDINGAPGTCTYSGSVGLNIKDSGVKSISLEATDNVGNKKKSSPMNITLDVSAPEVVNGLIVKYAGKDEELAVIGGKASLFVDLYFKIREDHLSSITLDLSQTSINPVVQYAYKNIDLSLSNCWVNESETGTGVKVYDCYIKSVPLALAGNTLNVGVTATDTYNNTGSSTLSKTFTVDNVEPKVSIKTDACDSIGKCYIHNGLNKFILTTNKNNFNNRYIFLNIPGSTFGVNQMQNCTGTECTASILLTCDSGSTVEVSIGSLGGLESQDDAGNVITPYITEVYCDDTPPSINDISITGENPGSVIKEIISGSTLTVTAKIVETQSDELVALANFGKAKNSTDKGTCTKVSNYDFNCVWVVSNVEIGYYETSVLINVTDVMGNTVSKQSNKFMVLGLKSDNETPESVNIKLGKLYPEELNRIVLDMAVGNGIPYYAYATYSLSADERPGQTVAVLHQQTDIGKCNYIGSIGTTAASQIFSEANIIDPYAGLDKKGKLEFKFNEGLDPNALDDEFVISCNISVIVKEGNYVYTNTQDLQLDMTFKAINSKLCKLGQDCTPGETFGKKLEDVENSFLVKSKIMGQIDALIPKLQTMCKLREYINTASFLNNVIGATASMIDLGVGVGGGNGLSGKIAGKSVQIGVRLDKLDQCLFGSQVRSGQQTSATNMALQLDQTRDGRTNVAGDLDLRTGNQLDAEKCAGLVGELCDKLTCSLTDDVVNKSIPDLATDGGLKKFMNRDVKPDVSNSIYAAYQAGCWPAVYYGINKWRQMDCNYLYCLKIASYTGTDVATCDKAKFAQKCMIVTGELYEWVPKKYTKYLDNAKDLVHSGLPLYAASLAKKTLCPEYIDFKTGSAGKVTYGGQTDDKGKPVGAMCSGEDGSQKTCVAKKIFLCQIPLQVASFADMQTRSRQSERFVYPSVPDMCAIANCFGKENCQYEPDMFKTINQINLPAGGNKINRDRNKETIVMRSKLGELRKTRFENQVKFDKANEDLNNINKQIEDTRNSAVISDVTVIGKKKTPGVSPPDASSGLDSKTELLNSLEKDRKAIEDRQLEAKKALDGSDVSVQKVRTCINEPGCDMATLLKDDSSNGIVNAEKDKEYPNLPAYEQLRMDQAQLDSYKRLQELYSAQSGAGGKGGLDTKEQVVYDDLLKAYGFKIKKGQLNPDGTRTPDKLVYDENFKDINGKEIYKDKTDIEVTSDIIKDKITVQEALIKNKGKIVRMTQTAEQFGSILQMGLQFLNANHMIDWMFGDFYVNWAFGKDVMDFLDMNKLRESLCNPDSIIGIQDEVEGNVISCASGFCLPVLTYATERANIEYPNGTKYYIYTVVYYISPGDIRGEDISYNVYFNGFGVKSMYGYKDDVELKSYQIMHIQKVFKSPNKYTELCIKFSDQFPSYNQILGISKDEYCREIKESGTWDTGSPMKPPEEEGYSDTNSTPEFDERGRRITATTNVNAEQPGVLE